MVSFVNEGIHSRLREESVLCIGIHECVRPSVDEYVQYIAMVSVNAVACLGYTAVPQNGHESQRLSHRPRSSGRGCN